MSMTSRERMLTAMRLEQPDMVPVAPDISNMIPCRLTGKPFWEIYLNNDPPLWKAYIDAVRYFKFEGWVRGHLRFSGYDDVSSTSEVISRTDERIVRRTVTHTPAGDLDSEVTYYDGDPTTQTVKQIKDLEEDFEKLRYLLRPPTGYDAESYEHVRREMDGDGIVYVGIGCPGFQSWVGWFDGGLEAMTYAYYDHKDLVLELRDLQHAQIMKMTEMALEIKPDCIQTIGSGGLALQSPAMFRELGLPTVQAMTKMCKEAGVMCMAHSCGPEYELVKMTAEETDLNCINPLEVPPMGDCDLAQLKREFGDKICLMGNLNTIEVMLRGTADDVEAACKQAIDDAAEGGGFILSTGDQCGRDTPDENMFRMIEVARTYGRYA